MTTSHYGLNMVTDGTDSNRRCFHKDPGRGPHSIDTRE